MDVGVPVDNEWFDPIEDGIFIFKARGVDGENASGVSNSESGNGS